MESAKAISTLDTGSLKSGWIACIVPFALLSAVGLIAVGSDVVRNGFRDPFHHQIIGLVMLAGFSAIFGWVLFRSFSRSRIRITDSALQIEHYWPIRNAGISVKMIEIEAFELQTTDILFNLSLRTTAKHRIPVVWSHGIKHLAAWKQELEKIAPIEHRNRSLPPESAP